MNQDYYEQQQAYEVRRLRRQSTPMPLLALLGVVGLGGAVIWALGGLGMLLRALGF